MKPYLHAGQHGFLKGRSTVTQLLECLHDWTSAIDSGQFVDVLYVDISKAFDSVSHPKLIAKLDRYGVRGHLLLWIKAFLADRRQRVVIDNKFSRWLPVESGVPQGSVLGPLLFLVYINDLPYVVRYAQVKLFADDLKIYIALLRSEPTTPLQDDIQEVLAWLNDNQLRAAFQ
ncbi:reverse transcriptase domain-containing protein, partial [Pseudoalteromonas sp.]|uniref:reverse transcriptase domain-containing protein n=1 Tax=Pseudoalteromonas sp. TaxID=53249 RepID=UPI0026075D92